MMTHYQPRNQQMVSQEATYWVQVEQIVQGQ